MPNPLTIRELAVLTGLAKGWSQRETASRLAISRNLVRTCIDTVLAKLNAASLPHAVALAIREQLVDVTDIPGGPT